ncbi:MAG: MurR/RpiR family transcriptional regulator [Tyzzerella sp.]|nr:MurR/RpiR family transcriptional regulator [Tyzzerella sp.]
MKSIFLNIRAKYDEMGPGERKIADLLTAKPSSILPLSITEFAEKAGCGNATLVRFSKRLGLNGYQDLKIAVAQEMATLSQDQTEITPSDTCYAMFTKRLRDVQVTLQKTRFALKPEAMDLAAKKIMNAKRIVIFGLGNSAAIAHDAQHKFLRVGLNAAACSDNHLQTIIASHLTPDCVAIGISHSGHSVDIVEALKLARICGATTICVTNHATSPITEVADICLFTQSEETQHSILGMSSRIAQLTIFDAIYTYIVANSDIQASKAIRDTESALKDKKY